MTRRRRETSDEERALFRETFRDARPHVPEKKLPADSTEKPETPEKKKAVPRLQPGLSGVDGRTSEKLRRGQLEPESRLDLHGLTEAAAHRALETFLAHARARGQRLVLVVTGKGLKSPAEDEPFDLELHTRSRGVLRNMVPRWLKEPALALLVADVRAAHRRHGGSGALYIYLRKSAR